MPTLKICDFSSPIIIGGQHNWNLKVVRRREQRGNLCLLFAETLFVYSFDWEENADRESDADKAINQSMRALAIRIDSRLISRAKKVVLYTFSHSSTCGERVNRRVLVINRILQICGPPRLDLCARRVSSSHARSALRTTAALHSDQYLISLIKIPVRRAYRGSGGGGYAASPFLAEKLSHVM